MARTALITGITGQDGSYLAEFLLEKEYRVVGMARRRSDPGFGRIAHLLPRLEVREADLLDTLSLIRLLEEERPDEVYNLASQSFVPASWRQPALTMEITALGATRMLEAIRLVNPKIRFYQASSSEMFGKAGESPQHERTALHPRSPYGVAKAYAHFMTVSYREKFGLFACSGILFNHESPRRGREFVTRKISYEVARIKHGLADRLALGNLDAARDWGFAGDYVEAMWRMLGRDQPGDYVVGSGVARTVRDFARMAFELAGLDWRRHVVVDPSLLRRSEVDALVADSSKARKELGWRPGVNFEGLVKMMVESDMVRMRRSVSRESEPAVGS